MRLLALVTDAFGAPGGIAQYNRDLFTALAGSEAIEHVDILPRNGTPPSKLPERLHQHNAQAGKLAYTAKALRLAKRNKPNRIFCGHINLLPLARWMARYTGAPIWLQLHGIDAWDKPRRTGKGLFDHVQLVTCVSRYTRRRFLSWANIDPSGVKVLPNTVATPQAGGVDLHLLQHIRIPLTTVTRFRGATVLIHTRHGRAFLIAPRWMLLHAGVLER